MRQGSRSEIRGTRVDTLDRYACNRRRGVGRDMLWVTFHNRSVWYFLPSCITLGKLHLMFVELEYRYKEH